MRTLVLLTRLPAPQAWLRSQTGASEFAGRDGQDAVEPVALRAKQHAGATIAIAVALE